VHLSLYVGTHQSESYGPGRPAPRTEEPAKALPDNAVASLLSTLSAEPERRRSDWIERDRALILTALLAGLRSDELVRANVGDIRPTDDGAVLQLTGKGGTDRRIPFEAPLVAVLSTYLDSRTARFQATTKKRSPTGGLAAWPASAPLFFGADGDRITRGTLQYRVLRAFRRAGIDRARGALVHGLRHTVATELANSEVDVYTLMNLLGHESMVTSQRYVTGCWQPNETGRSVEPAVHTA
jgi:site-specific recombinase XerD